MPMKWFPGQIIFSEGVINGQIFALRSLLVT